MSSNLANKWILITGASSGFGAAAARRFGTQGCRLLLGARRLDKLERVAQESRAAGAPAAVFHHLDVSRTNSVEAFVAWAREEMLRAAPGLTEARLDVLVNNAGGAHGLDPVATAQDEDWEAMFQSNLIGLLRVTRACLPMLTANPGSMIINLGSVAGRTAYEGGAAYCAAKAGERAITQALRLELNGTGVRVGTLDPGMAETEFSNVRFKGDTARAKKVYEGVTPLTAEDVAEAMVWMASRPPHVNIDEMVIKCTDQAEVYKVHRRQS
jgi:NADP-dependent 3-hydroxy acid dehydrogenase YdfG